MHRASDSVAHTQVPPSVRTDTLPNPGGDGTPGPGRLRGEGCQASEDIASSTSERGSRPGRRVSPADDTHLPVSPSRRGGPRTQPTVARRLESGRGVLRDAGVSPTIVVGVSPLLKTPVDCPGPRTVRTLERLFPVRGVLGFPLDVPVLHDWQAMSDLD